MQVQQIAERVVAYSIADQIIDGRMDYARAGVTGVAAQFVEPMAMQYSQSIDPNQRLLMKALISSGVLYAYDYMQGGTYGYIQYLKKGFTSEALLYIYNMKK